MDIQGVTFGRPVYASFDLLDLPWKAGLPVRIKGALAETTNGKGRLLVTNAPALMRTTLGLRDKNLPVGAEIGHAEKEAGAPRQGGVCVSFAVLTQKARGFATHRCNHRAGHHGFHAK